MWKVIEIYKYIASERNICTSAHVFNTLVNVCVKLKKLRIWMRIDDEQKYYH